MENKDLEMEKIELDELEEVNGGNDGSESGRNIYMVTNAAGANVRKEKTDKSAKVGHYTKGALLRNVGVAEKGVKGNRYKWCWVPGQGGQKGGYIASHLLKRA